MALRVAVANGNWSNPAIWNGGLLPNPEDIVASNTYTVTIDQNINVDSLTNTAQLAVAETPKMTSNTTPSGIASSNDEGYGSFAWQAFANNVYQGGDISSRWITFGTASVSNPKWLAYEFTTPKVIVKYEIRHNSASTGSTDPRDWTFEAWDGSIWIVLDTRTNQTHTTVNVEYDIVNSTAYFKYRINITSSVNGGNVQINEFRMFSTSLLSSAVAGGGFILNDGVTLTTTGTTGLSASSSLIDFSSNGTATINCGTGNIVKPTTSNTSLYAIRVSGGGTLNVTGNISFLSSNSRTIIVNTTAGATLNFTGNINAGQAPGIATLVSCTVNIVGNIFGCTTNGPLGGVDFMANGTLNITGNVYGSSGFNNNGYGVRMGLGNLNITGNIYGSTNNQGTSDYGVFLSNIATVYITGNIYGGTSLIGSNHWGLVTLSAVYLSQVGGIYSGYNIGGLTSSNNSAINLFSGPFICSEYGFFPYQVVRMHLIPSASSYIEFRDETTGGASAPFPAAPPTQLISPSTLISNLAISDVRFGTVYAMGTLTGALRMPTPNQVTFGVAVDDTFGNSVLTAASVWDYLVSNITVEGSIGMRLKNVATPQTIGEQLEAFLRLD